jgi:hypothetical protein
VRADGSRVFDQRRRLAWLSRVAQAIAVALALAVAGAGPAWGARLPGATARGPGTATASSASCVGSGLPRPTVAILTDQQATADLHQAVTLAQHSGGATPGCVWDGNAVPPGQRTPYHNYQVQLYLGVLGPYGSVAAAHSVFASRSDAFGTPTPAPGIGSEAAFAPGQDEITSQLVVRGGDYVFTVSLNSALSQSTQRADLTAVADDILVRLGQPPPTHASHRWATDWAGAGFCHTRADGTQYLHTTWHGVAACGARYPNNFQGTIEYKHVVFDTVGFQCVELAERYFYYVTGLPGPFANGSDLAEAIFYAWRKQDPRLGLYPTGVLGRTSTYQSTLVAGDIISMWSPSDSVAGHVAVVMGVSLHGSSGHKTGSITVLDENTVQPNGIDTIQVNDGRMWFPDGSYPYFQWLYGVSGS